MLLDQRLNLARIGTDHSSDLSHLFEKQNRGHGGDLVVLGAVLGLVDIDLGEDCGRVLLFQAFKNRR